MKQFAFVIFLLVLFVLQSFSQENRNLLTKIEFVVQLAEEIEWPNEAEKQKIRIAYYGSEPVDINAVLSKINNLKIKSKSIQFTVFSNISDIQDVEILILSSDIDNRLYDILLKVAGKQILVVSDESKCVYCTMINLKQNSSAYGFELNKMNFWMQGLKYTDRLLEHNGIELDLAGLLRQNASSMATDRELVRQQQKQMERQLQLISRQKKELSIQQISINNQKAKLILQQELQIVQSNKIILSNENIAQKLEELKEQKDEIDKQKQLIEVQKNDIISRIEVLEQQNAQIARQKLKILNQNNVLKELGLNIAFQKSIMYIISFALLFVLIIGLYVYRIYRQKQKVNKILESKNLEISAQSEELMSITDNLVEANNQLEKLSIVAAKTDNAIMLVDNKGDIEWINDAYVRLYGYTFDEILENKGSTIFQLSTNSDIEELFFHVINKRESVHYESKTESKDGHSFYVRTTLSPIIDEDELVNRLVAIETDVSDMRKAQQEISSQAFEFREINEMLSDQKGLLEAKNENINASIRSAEIIQSTILPQNKDLNERFETFVLYRPKEIVSGDFYWHAKFSPKHSTDEYHFYAAVDCTGHGVPGAFMSVIGSRLLSEIVFIDKVIEPNKILKSLNKKFVRALNQKITDNRDGMDVSLIRIKYEKDKKMTEFVFSGAKRNLYIAKANNDEITIVKGNRRKIGGPKTRNMQEFAQQKFECEFGTTFYLTSDGFVDQNNPIRKRYGTKRFLEKLSQIKNLSMPDQLEQINKDLEAYMEYSDQRDDITIMAVKII